ncbi:MAG: DEAD/DEAH box helicase family protein [Planctomycetota bacterium]
MAASVSRFWVASLTTSKANLTDVPRTSLSDLKPFYRSSRDELGRDFFGPCLKACVRYRRAASFFSSSALRAWATALPDLIHPSSDEPLKSIQLLVAPLLSQQDINALKTVDSAEERRSTLIRLADNILTDALLIGDEGYDHTERSRRLMAYLIAAGRMELRFAFARHLDDAHLYHPKFGIFDLNDSRRVAFTGSANETAGGHRRNYESIDVFLSWVAGDEARVEDKANLFDATWANHEPGVEVVLLSEAALKKVQAWSSEHPPLHHTVKIDDAAAVGLPLWRHQKAAVACFLEAKRGVLEMATGTGKTRVALHLIATLFCTGEVGAIVVTADGTDLLDQWHGELLGLNTQLPEGHRFALYRHYSRHHEGDLFTLAPAGGVLLCSRDALPPVMADLSAEVGEQTLLIHDEVHRLGSPSNRTRLAGLSNDIPYRLGLSATPEREYDESGNAFIEQDVGPTLFNYPLEDAIRDGILCPFEYLPLDYYATADDQERMRKVFDRKAARELAGEPMSDIELAIELSKVYKTSLAKLPLFDEAVTREPNLLRRCILFVETREYGERVLELVHTRRDDFHTYFSGEDAGTLQRFASGSLECLVTCHRLSEGIDIRDVANVFLFSSARSRLETIQRIGRCLRRDPDNPNKQAKIIDFTRIGGTEENNPDIGRREWLEGVAAVRPKPAAS